MQIIKSKILPALIALWPLYAVVLISILVHWPWLNIFGIFTSGDWWYISEDKYSDYLQFSPVWVTDNLGGTSATPHYYAIRFFESIFSMFGASFAITEKIFYFIPVVILAPIGAYLLCKTYANKYIAAIGALVFCFNTVFIFNQVGPFTIAVAYSLTPFVFYYARKFIVDGQQYRYIVYLAIVFNVMVLYELRIALLVALITGLYFIYQFVMYKQIKIRSLFFVVSIIFISVLLLQSFWIIPYILSSRSVTFSDLLSRGLFVSYSDITNAFALSHPFWTGARPATFEVHAIAPILWVIPIICFLYFIFYSKDKDNIYKKDYIFWIFLTLVGIFLVKQANLPFEFVYAWLFDKIPGFSAFRESSKFYIFIILGYTVGVVFILNYLATYVNKQKLKKSQHFILNKMIIIVPVVAIIGVVVVNATPLLTTSFKTTVVERTVPDAYKKLSEYLSKEPYSRVMWIPADSRWGYSTNVHPKVNITSITPGAWKDEIKQFSSSDTLRDTVFNVLNDDKFAQDLISNADVKYIVVPMRDIDNDDDFFKYYGNDRQFYVNLLDSKKYLTKVDIGSDEISIYKTNLDSAYIKVADTVQSVGTGSNRTNIKDFVENELGQKFNYTITGDDDSKNKTKTVSTDVQDIFGKVTDTDIKPDYVKSNLKVNQGTSLYLNKSNNEYSYVMNESSLRVSSVPKVHPMINGLIMGNKSIAETRDISIGANNKNTFIDVDGDISLLKADKLSHLVGSPNSKLRVHSSQSKINGLDVISGDCTENKDNGGVFTFKVQEAVQCFTKRYDVTSSNTRSFYLSHDYQLTGTNDAGISVKFDNGSHEINQFKSFDKNWHTYSRVIDVPEGAKYVDVTYYAYPQYSLLNDSVTQYKNVSLSEFPIVADFTDNLTPDYERISTTAAVNKIIYPVRSSENVISNPSFETGLWQKTVGDCNAYDTMPELGMKQAKNASSGKYSLELQARRHIACTSREQVPVKEGSTYMLSFDYQSDNSVEANYYVAFKGKNESNIAEKINIKDSAWNHHSKLINIPLGVDRIDIVVYAKATDGRTSIVNRYDNFKLQQTVDISNQYYSVIKNTKPTASLPTISYEAISATNKIVKISKIAGPTNILMSETYNSLWGITPSTGNSIRDLFGGSYLSDDVHYIANGWQNGWYIDPEDICKNNSNSCSKNDDGSYDIELSILFRPQKFVLIGSGVAVVSLLTTLAFVVIIKFRRKS